MDVAPKKANWDLRRDIAEKLAKVERRTQVHQPQFPHAPCKRSSTAFSGALRRAQWSS